MLNWGILGHMSKRNQKRPTSCDGCRSIPDPPDPRTPELKVEGDSIFWELNCGSGQRVLVRQSRSSADPVSFMTRVGATKHGNNCPFQDYGPTRLERIISED